MREPFVAAASPDMTLGQRCLVRWVDLVCGSAAIVLLLVALTSGGSLIYAIGHLGIDTSTKEMLSEDLPFRRNGRAMDEAFPQLEHQILVVVEADSAEQAEDAAARVAAGLAARTERIRNVFYPEGAAYFRRNGLLYLDLEELQSLSDRLAQAQPLLAALSEDQSLRGLAELLRVSAENEGEVAANDLGPALGAMADTVESLADGRPSMLSWASFLTGQSSRPEAPRHLITVEPVLDYGSLAPAAPAIGEIRDVLRDLGLSDTDGVRVRVTGESVMMDDELKNVREGLGLVGLLSLVLVSVLLSIGLRSLRLVVATLLTLSAGLCWTAGFAALAVGALNLLSVTFTILFIGLSVDFGIHFALRSKEEAVRGATAVEALKSAAAGVGGPLTLTAVAAAIGFFSFLPTTYRGLSELGLISGVGMFIALFANLTVLPALLSLWPPSASPSQPMFRAGDHFDVIVGRRAVAISWGALVLGGLAILALPWARFDDDPLNLRDPNSPSVATLLDIIADQRVQPYEVKALTSGADAAVALADRLKALPEVGKTVTLLDYVPRQQEDKLAVIDEMAFFLAPIWSPTPVDPLTSDERNQAYVSLKRTAGRLSEGPASESAARLVRALERLGTAPADLLGLEHALLGNLPGRLAALGEAMEAGPVTLEDLPEALVRRKLAADGRSIVDIDPADDLRDRELRQRFVDAVQAVVPDATGSPITITEAGRAVVQAFLQAAGTAVLLIALLLLAILRNVRDSLLVLAPLALAALLTIAVTVVFDLSFNFANVIVLPLLFGLGVAGGIHMVARSRGALEGELMNTSTPRAVLFSSLTTIGSFGALSLSGHRGTASMGELLTIAIGLSMLTCLIVLPALLTVNARRRLREIEVHQ